VHSNSKRVFWAAIDNAFQTDSFSRQTLQGSTGQSFNQKVYVKTSGKQLAKGTNEIIQSGDGGFHVLTNIVGTPVTDYVSYVSVKTDQKNAKGDTLDYSSILGLWGKSDPADPSQTNGQLYNQSVLGALPISNLSFHQRKQLVKLIKDKNVYTTDYTKVDKKIIDGRPTYVYNVSVDAVAYITMLKEFGKMVGLTQLAQADPNQYGGSAPLHFQFIIDVWTHQVKKIRYSGSVREEVYGSYGIRSRLSSDLPKDTISVQELQQRVQSIE
jgi:hypothetical protein